MPRPLMQHGIGQLESLFAKSKVDQSVLKQLEQELQYRQVPRAVALLAEVQAAMYGETPATPPIPVPPPPSVRPATPSTQQPGLWEPPAVPVAHRPVVATTRPPGPPGVSKPPPPTTPPMPVEEAYRVLKATAGSTWESIEQTRRQLVQQSCPARLKPMSAEKRVLAQAEARRVNEAYAVLHRARADAA